MATSASKSADKDKVFDVAKPGKTAPDASSRPTIIGHRTLLHDPMVKTEEAPKAEVKDSPAATKVKIMPLEDEAKEEKPKAVKDEAPVEKSSPVVEETQPSKDKEPEEEKAPEPAEPAAEESSKSSESEDRGDQSLSEEAQKEADKKIQEEAAKAEALEKMVADKKYYAPIGVKSKKRSKHRSVLWIFIILILAAALGDLLIDSGMIKTSFKPPVRFFNNGL